MKIYNIEPTNFKAAINISCKENKGKIYLYNEVNNITKEFKIPATFRTNNIELPSVTDKVINKLKELGIKFSPKI